MLYFQVLLSALAALSAAQRASSPRDAAILAEERYLSVDGKFGAAYEQEDGVQFTEESDAEGNRRGSYSYVDPTGQRHTVNYVAGKNGFQPTGDHIPAIPAPVVNPLPQYNAPRQQQAYSSPSQYGSPAEDDGQWVDDTRQEYPSNTPARPQYSPPPQQYSAPQPQYNPPPQQYSAPQPQYNPPPQQNSAPQQQYNPPAQQYNPPAQQWSAPTAAPAQQRWSVPVDPTPAPHRFQPPGKLNLNRSPDGFSFSFKKS